MIRTAHPGDAAETAARPAGYPHDPDFPQLWTASDPARMLEIFRAHLKPVPGKACRILSCAPFRFRCRPSKSRCVLQYTLRLAEAGTGREWDQWVTGLLYAGPGEARKVWRELRASNPLGEIPESWRTFEPLSYIPELDMVVEVFPCDRRVPQLGRVLEGAARGVEPLLLSRLGSGRWRADGATIEPTRYRTEMGAALRCTISAREPETGRRGTHRCHIKVYRNERGGETFEFLRSWWRRARGGLPYSLVRPLAYWSDLRALVLEEAEGKSLRQILLEEADAAHAVRATARALAAFQQDGIEPPRSSGLDEQLDFVNRGSVQIQWACPHLKKDVEDIAATVASSLVDGPAVAIHGDFKLDHVFLGPGRVQFIDLDSAARGDPVRDPAQFYSHVVGRAGLEGLPRDKALALARAFVDEYFSRVPQSWRRQFGLHCAAALIDVACGIFRHQRPGWREQIAAAVHEARYVLASPRP